MDSNIWKNLLWSLTWSSGSENSFQKFLIETNDEAAIFVFDRQLGVMRNGCIMSQ